MKEKNIIVDFDELPYNVGERRGSERFLTIADSREIIDYLYHKIRGHDIDTIILCGYLPTAMWIEIGAYLSSQDIYGLFECAKYQLPNKSPSYLPITSGDLV